VRGGTSLADGLSRYASELERASTQRDRDQGTSPTHALAFIGAGRSAVQRGRSRLSPYTSREAWCARARARKESAYARRGQRARTRSRSTRRPRRYRRDTASSSGGMPLHWPSCADGAGSPQPAPGCRHPGCGHAERCRQTRCAVWCNLACGLLLLRWFTRVPSASSPTVGCGGGSLHKYHRTGADAQ
jgi:hypothetical protein